MFNSTLVYLFCIYCILQSLFSNTHKRLDEQTIHTMQQHILTIMYKCQNSMCHLETYGSNIHCFFFVLNTALNTYTHKIILSHVL